MSRDIQRIGSAAATFAEGKGPNGLMLGPKGREVFYKIRCVRTGKWGPGECSVYEITREGPGATGLRARDQVGNLYGLIHQLSRDTVRLWGCTPARTAGFEGARRRSRLDGAMLTPGRYHRGMNVEVEGAGAAWVIVKATDKTITVASSSGVDPGTRFRGKHYQFRWDGVGYARRGRYLRSAVGPAYR